MMAYESGVDEIYSLALSPENGCEPLSMPHRVKTLNLMFWGLKRLEGVGLRFEAVASFCIEAFF